MLPLIFKRKKTAEFLRQNSGDMEERKKHGDPHHPHHPHHPHRPRTLEDSVYSGGGSQSCSFEGAQGSNPGGGGNPPRHGGGVGVDGGVGGGSGEGYYLSTGSGCSYYDCSRAVPQARRSPSPVGSGEWALRECEVHTTWLNELRKRLGQPTITDLRTAVADGITLVQLTEALTHIEVSAADQEPPLSRPQALVNLDRCLAHLAACGVDVIGIQASDLVEGDLKSLLLLLGQIRRRYEPAQGHRVQGDGDQRSAGTATERVTVHPARPFSDMPGRIDTSPQLPRASQRTDRAVSQMKRGPVVDEDRMIPGMMTSEEHAVMSSGHGLQQSADRHNHSTYKSSQHAPAASAKPSPAPRPQSSIGVTSERPPSQLGVAWAADSASKPRQVPPECNHGNCSHGNHVEDVGKRLDSMRISRDKKRSIHYV